MTVQSPQSSFTDRHSGPMRIEIIPSEGIIEQVTAKLPLATTLTVTCLPAHIAGIHLYSFNSLDSLPGGPGQASTSSPLRSALSRGAAHDT